MFECEIEGFVNVQKFRKVYEKKCECIMEKYELRKIELDVLLFLDKYEDFDTAKDIVSYKCLSKAHVSKALDNLVRKEYIITSEDKEDRRCLRLTITNKARPVVKELNMVWNQIIEIIYTDFSKEEKETIQKAFAKISKNIDFELEDK